MNDAADTGVLLLTVVVFGCTGVRLLWQLYRYYRKPRTAAAALRAVRKLLTPPGHWTKRSYAVRLSGTSTDPTSKYAVAWCALGALEKIDGPAEGTATLYLVKAIQARHPCLFPYSNYELARGVIVGWNDDIATHAEVLEVLDEAARNAAAQP